MYTVCFDPFKASLLNLYLFIFWKKKKTSESVVYEIFFFLNTGFYFVIELHYCHFRGVFLPVKNEETVWQKKCENIINAFIMHFYDILVDQNIFENSLIYVLPPNVFASLRFFQACNIFIDAVTRWLDASWLNIHWGKILLNLQ